MVVSELVARLRADTEHASGSRKKHEKKENGVRRG
jgi:hypothetical protein